MSDVTLDAQAAMVKTSPRRIARLAGVFQLLEGAAATFGQVYLLSFFIVARNPAGTAERILANEPLFQVGFAISIIAIGFHLARALLMFELLKIVRKGIAKFALLIIVVGCAIQAVTSLLYIAPLAILRSPIIGLQVNQLQDVSYMLLRLNGFAFNIYLVFFGFWCLLTGFLIYKSSFMPRILGVLLMVTGIGWMLNLYPLIAQQAATVMMVAAAIGEIPLLIWLLVRGVNNEKWWDQAGAAAALPGP